MEVDGPAHKALATAAASREMLSVSPVSEQVKFVPTWLKGIEGHPTGFRVGDESILKAVELVAL